MNRGYSVWRPINRRVDDQPLAVSDGSLVDEDDLLATDHVTRHHVGETYNVLHRTKYRWYYISHQEVDEVLLFKTYDSSTGVPARRMELSHLAGVGLSQLTALL